MKPILRIILLLLCSSQAFGQLKIGLRFAPQLTWSTPDNKNTSSNAARANLSYGLMCDYYLTENYAIGTEISMHSYGTNLILNKSKFTQIVYNSNNFPNTQSLTYDYQLQYIQIPVIIKMRTKEIGYMRYYGEFGFGAGILTRAKANINSGNFSLNNVNINEPDATDKFVIEAAPNVFSDKVATFRGSMIIGAGIQYNFFSNSLLLAGIRYENAFSSFTDDEKLNTRMHFIALNLGILF